MAAWGTPATRSSWQDNRPPVVQGKLISIDPDPLGVSMPAAGVALLEKWYPDSFRFVDKASAQFFEHFEIGKE